MGYSIVDGKLMGPNGPVDVDGYGNINDPAFSGGGMPMTFNGQYLLDSNGNPVDPSTLQMSPNTDSSGNITSGPGFLSPNLAAGFSSATPDQQAAYLKQVQQNQNEKDDFSRGHGAFAWGSGLRQGVELVGGTVLGGLAAGGELGAGSAAGTGAGTGTSAGTALGGTGADASFLSGAGQGALTGGGVGGSVVGADGAVAGTTAAGAGAASGTGGLTASNVLQGAGLASKALGGGTATGGGALSSTVGAGLNLAGANQSLQAYEEAQRKAEAAGQFTPYNVYSGMGSTTFANGAATSTLSPQYQQLRDQYLGNASAGASAAGAFDPNKAASDLYTQMQAEAAPGESQDRANALAQLQAMGQTGLGVGDVVPGSGSAANPLYAALLKAQADAGRQRQISSYSTAQDTANQLQQRALGWAGAGSSLDQQSTAGLAQGANLGAIQTSGALGGARLAQQPILSQGATKGGVLSGIGNSLLGPGGLGGAVGQIGTGIGNLFTGGTTPSLPAAPPAGNGGGGDTTGAFNNFTGGFGDQSYTGGFYDPNSSSLYNFT